MRRLVFFLGFLILGGLPLLWFFKSDRDAIFRYQKLEEKSRQSKNKEPSLHHSKQVRKEVCKDLWIDATPPLHIKIKTPTSYLSIDQKEQNVSLVEKLELPVCLVQEKRLDTLEIPWQTVRRIEAKEAIYDYNTGDLTASEVTLSNYRLEGHEFPQTLPISPKSIIRGDFAEGRSKKNDDSGVFLDTLTLIGNVTIRSFDETTFSSALADRIEVDFKQSRLFLYGNPALFYDEAQNLELAAKQIEAFVDPETGKKKIKGHGKVRLSLTDTEFTKLGKSHICY